MNSWDHAIKPIGRHCNRRCCSSPKCPALPAYLASYRYVTGRRGRTSTQERELCEAHGKSFAAKHGLDLPAPGRPTLYRGQYEDDGTEAFRGVAHGGVPWALGLGYERLTPHSEGYGRVVYRTREGRKIVVVPEVEDETLTPSGTARPYGRCDTCGAPCDEGGCTKDRRHGTANED